MACSCKLLCGASSMLFTVSLLAVATGAAASNPVRIAVYWGQDGNEDTLNETCSTGLYAYVNLAFLNVFGGGLTPALNLAGHCNAIAGACAALSNDIASCQSQGVRVLLSIGGGSTGRYNLTSASDAQDVATYIWSNFLGGTSRSRPLGATPLDGIDFDIQTGIDRYYDDLAKKLTSLYKGDSSKKYMLTAGPQCPYPDASLGAALKTGLFDNVWVQFFNNPPCQYASGDVSTLQSAWQQWTAALPSASVFLGLPASPDAAGSGFIDADTLASRVLPVVKGASNYGGVMLWNRYYDAGTGYSAKLQGIANKSIAIVPNPSQFPGDASKKRIRIYVIAGTSSLVGLCLFLTIFFLWYKKYYDTFPCRRGSKNIPRIESFLEKEANSHPKRYTYPEVRKMTNSYGYKLGQGGFGGGKLPDGREVAVKMLKDTKGDGEEFMNEVASISRTSHVNVVTLLGFCLQGSKRALVYEYMANDSLERYTFGNSSAEDCHALTWERLFDIVLGIARGLDYLHRGCNTRILHFDIKPQTFYWIRTSVQRYLILG